MMKKLHWFLVIVLTLSSVAIAQDKLLTLDDIFSPDANVRVRFGGMPVSAQWAADGRSCKQVVGGRLMRVDAMTAQAVPYFDSGSLSAALQSRGVSTVDANALSNSTALDFSPDESAVLINNANDLWYYNISDRTLKQLTNNRDEEKEADFSPDGRWVSFVRGNNLYAIDVAKGNEKQLTRDGKEGDKAIYNGYL